MSTEIPEDSIVIAVRVVVHRTEAISSGRSSNHWSIYLVLNDNKSVRLNMRDKTRQEWPYPVPAGAGYGDPATLDITVHEYSHPHSTLCYWDCQPSSNRLKVRDFVNFLLRNNRTYYTMAVGGSGCRFWVYTIINDFSTFSLLENNSPELLYPHMMAYYSERGGVLYKEPTDTMPRGKFWKVEDWNREFRT
ncbi:hypothetical protein TWF718_005747 [Orbilia javanica]|uniref:DUF7770 domain-containing protein n=1 Tax=Orbilia javanica TaxID=47235 RepID=A0AAN8MVE7_9PEZI